MGKNAIDRRIGPGGRWQRLLPGVYLTVTGTPTQDQREMGALFYAGPGGTLTGPAALRRHGIRALPAQVIDVLIPANRVRQSTGFVLIRQTRRLPELVCYSGCLQYALPARAVADAVHAIRDLATVRAVVAAAVQTRLRTAEQLQAELADGAVRGSAQFRAALAEVRLGTRSAPEASLLDLIKRGRLPMPLFNPLLYAGREPLARPDAWWPDCAVAVEVDSRQWHLSPDDWEETMRRHGRMTAFGIHVLHFSPRQIRLESDDLLATIRAALASRRGSSVPAIRTVPAA